MRQPHAVIKYYLASADVLVLPNRSGSDVSERYTSPLKLFEYMASQVPILASRLPSIEDAVSEKEVFFFGPDDSSQLIDGVRQVLESPAEADRKAARAYEKAKELSWDAYADRVLAALFEF